VQLTAIVVGTSTSSKSSARSQSRRRHKAGDSPRSGGSLAPRAPYHPHVPRSWAIAMTILVCCLVASIVIAIVKLV
jgi:hypothetical protein